MTNFLIALQFLTRIRLGGHDDVSPERFGASVAHFPLVGAVIGASLAALCYAAEFWLPVHATAAILVVAGIFITGGLHCDGLMDSADGLLSGRSRERMLEIMKDSRVGAHGVTVFAALLLLKWSLLLDLLSSGPFAALFAMPVLARLAMTVAITSFPYARPEGIGQAFAVYAGPRARSFAVLSAALLMLPLGPVAWAALAAAFLFALWAGRRITAALGGLTGDTYGAVAELAEVLVLLIFVLLADWDVGLWELITPEPGDK